VDQLPTSLVEVLRSASVLGVMFNAGVLQAMLSHRVSGDAEMLDYQLHALQESNLIAPAGRREYDRTCGYSEHDDIWKFSNVLHRDVVYQSLPHRHRRSLHYKAAEALREQLLRAHGHLDSRRPLQALVHHMMRAVHSSGGSTDKGKNEHKRRVLLLAETLIEAAIASHALGIYKEAFQYRLQVQALLYKENTITSIKSRTLLLKESDAVDQLQNAITAVLLFCPSVIRTLFQDHHAKLQELSARQGELRKAIAKLKRTAPEAKATYLSSGSNLPLARRVETTAVYQPFLEEMFTSMGFMRPESCAQVAKEFYEGLPGWSDVETAYRGSHVIIVLQNSLPCWEFAELSETIYEAFQRAGSPYRMTEVGGYSIMICIAEGMLNRVCQGVIAGPSEDAARGVFEALEASQCGFMASYWECLEAAWEPLTSPRVQRVRTQRVQAGSPTPPWWGKPECLDELYLAESAAQRVPSNSAHPAEGDASDSEVLAELAARLAGANGAARKSATFALPLPRACVAAFCVRHGCRLLFSAAAGCLGAPGALPSRSAAQLEVLCCALSRCLAEWADNGCNVFGEYTYFPATLVMGRAMLHLFQWVLVSQGCRTAPPEAVTLPQGVHGSYPPGSTGAHATGLSAVIGGLLLAQRIGMGRGEVMPACLPATVVVARLLAGQDGVRAQRTPAAVVVPASLPATGREGHEAAVAVEVRRVELGSAAARVVALRHLTELLAAVTVRGERLAVDTVQSPADTADSHSLWEAVHLRRQLMRQQDALDSGGAPAC